MLKLLIGWWAYVIFFIILQAKSNGDGYVAKRKAITHSAIDDNEHHSCNFQKNLSTIGVMHYVRLLSQVRNNWRLIFTGKHKTKLRSICPWIASLLQVNPQNCRVLAFVEMWIHTPYFENKPFVKLVPKVIFRFDKDK